MEQTVTTMAVSLAFSCKDPQTVILSRTNRFRRGAVWAYILFFVLLGPEMTQEEREERAVEAKEFEELRLSGQSLAEMGAQRIRTKAAKSAEHVEEVDDDPEGKEAKTTKELV